MLLCLHEKGDTIMPKGNPRPVNNARISLSSEFMDALASFPNPKGIPRDFQIALLTLKNPEFKKHFIAMHGEECYKEHLERYSRNRSEMTHDKEKRNAEKEKRRRERIKLKREELEVKKRELDIREENTGIRKTSRLEEDLDDFSSALNQIKLANKFEKEGWISRAKEAIERIREIEPSKALACEKKLEKALEG